MKKYITEHQDGELIVTSESEMIQAEQEAEEFDGILGFIVLREINYDRENEPLRS